MFFWNELLKDGAAEIIYENELITIGIIPKKNKTNRSSRFKIVD